MSAREYLLVRPPALILYLHESMRLCPRLLVILLEKISGKISSV